MPKLVPVSWKECVRRLRKFGFEGPYWGGRHPYMLRGDTSLTIPNIHRKEVSIDLLSRMLKQADIGRDEWLKMK